MNVYDPLVLTGSWLIIATLFVQWAVAAAIKAKQPGAIPGKVPDDISHESLVFRTHRTFMNSLENVPMFLFTVGLGIVLGLESAWFGYWVMLFAVARIVHMVLYYAIATEKNPSPRSWFFVLGAIANAAVLLQCALFMWA